MHRLVTTWQIVLTSALLATATLLMGCTRGIMTEPDVGQNGSHEPRVADVATGPSLQETKTVSEEKHQYLKSLFERLALEPLRNGDVAEMQGIFEEGFDWDEVRDGVTALVRAPDAISRLNGTKLLWIRKFQATAATFLPLLTDPDERVRSAALFGYLLTAPTEERQTAQLNEHERQIIKAAASADETVALDALEALGRLHTVGAIAAVRQALESHPKVAVRMMALKTLRAAVADEPFIAEAVRVAFVLPDVHHLLQEEILAMLRREKPSLVERMAGALFHHPSEDLRGRVAFFLNEVTQYKTGNGMDLSRWHDWAQRNGYLPDE